MIYKLLAKESNRKKVVPYYVKAANPVKAMEVFYQHTKEQYIKGRVVVFASFDGYTPDDCKILLS